MPDSGDDDGVVDAVFIVTHSTPAGFLVGAATGVANLGLAGAFVTDDAGFSGKQIRRFPSRGAVV